MDTIEHKTASQHTADNWLWCSKFSARPTGWLVWATLRTLLNSVKREKPTRYNHQMYIINFCFNMFRASLCPSSGKQRPCVTAYGVLLWFCWMGLVAVVGALRCRMRALLATIRCLLSTSVSTCFGHNYAHLQENKDRVLLHMVYCAGSAGCGW